MAQNPHGASKHHVRRALPSRDASMTTLTVRNDGQIDGEAREATKSHMETPQAKVIQPSLTRRVRRAPTSVVMGSSGEIETVAPPKAPQEFAESITESGAGGGEVFARMQGAVAQEPQQANTMGLAQVTSVTTAVPEVPPIATPAPQAVTVAPQAAQPAQVVTAAPQPAAPLAAQPAAVITAAPQAGAPLAHQPAAAPQAVPLAPLAAQPVAVMTAAPLTYEGYATTAPGETDSGNNVILFIVLLLLVSGLCGALCCVNWIMWKNNHKERHPATHEGEGHRVNRSSKWYGVLRGASDPDLATKANLHHGSRSTGLRMGRPSVHHHGERNKPSSPDHDHSSDEVSIPKMGHSKSEPIRNAPFWSPRPSPRLPHTEVSGDLVSTGSLPGRTSSTDALPGRGPSKSTRFGALLTEENSEGITKSQGMDRYRRMVESHNQSSSMEPERVRSVKWENEPNIDI